MTLKVNDSAFVAGAAESIGLSTMFAATASTTNPTYLVLTALDRDEYTAGASGATGSFSGNGQSVGFTGIGSDGRGAGIVFTYQPSTGRYYSSLYGYFDQLRYNASGSKGDVANISLFTTSDLGLATAYAANPYAMMQLDPGGYVGSVTVATVPGFIATAPAQATPLSIAAAATSFVGSACNMDGCWILASTIAAEAGASLPVQSTAIGLTGQASGEWIVAFNGPAGQSGNWQSMITTGEMVAFGTPGGGGHITTVVSGSGSSAMLVDNITYENASGQITNPANDGSADDVIVAAPHPASQEWAGVQASSVVIYELDTPIVTMKVAKPSIAAGGSQILSAWFAATDPANRGIVSYQIYDSSPSGAFTVAGLNQAAHSAAAALTIASLSTTAYLAANAAGTDTIDIRAFNGSYWDDWQAFTVTVTAAVALAAPVVTAPTAAQTWTQGQRVSLALAANSFADPQGQALSYSATLASGQALPSWLTFNAAALTFSGQVPIGIQTLTVSLTAKDTSGLSASEQFTVTIPAAPPTVSSPTQAQQWTAGKSVTFALPVNTFTDPQGQKLVYAATQTNGQPLPSWLSFNASTDIFSGTAPITQQTLGLKVTATDTSGLSVSEGFVVSITPAGPVLANQTADLKAVDGQPFSYALPVNTFTDVAGQHLSYLAYQVAGPSVTSWLHFNTATATLSGVAPSFASGIARVEIVATDGNHLSASESFNLSYAPAPTVSAFGATTLISVMSAVPTFSTASMQS